MASNEKKSDLDRLGIFQEVGYNTINEPYQSRSNQNGLFNESASKGKRLVVETTKSLSGLNEGYFNQFQRAFTGEAYSDPLKIRREYQKKNREKIRGAPVFHLPSISKKPEGSGNYYGTFSGPITAMSADFVTMKDKSKPTVPEKRNFFTNPSKQGTGYGYPNVTINKFPDYISELPQKIDKPNNVNNKPAFKVTTSSSYFNPNPFNGKFDTGYNDKMQQKTDLTKPFHFKPGYLTETINPMPEYKTEPYNDKLKRPLPYLKKIVNNSGRIYYPTPGLKSIRQPSIMDCNIHKAINRTNYGSVTSIFSL